MRNLGNSMIEKTADFDPLNELNLYNECGLKLITTNYIPARASLSTVTKKISTFNRRPWSKKVLEC